MNRIALLVCLLMLLRRRRLRSAQDWKPNKPVTIIVPWAAGGSTDQVTRITAAELEKHLGQKVVIVNQPGASGSIGTKSALEAPKDGYTWTAGAAQDLGVYRALGMLETKLADWHLFLNVANVPVVGVNPATPYKSMKDLLDAMKAQARPDHRRHRRRDLRRAQRDGGDRARRRRQVPARHLRRRQSRGGGHRGRRDAGHHPARGRAGRDDPRQAHPSARHGERQGARARGLRRDRARSRGRSPA